PFTRSTCRPMDSPLNVLCVGTAPAGLSSTAFGPFSVKCSASLDQAAQDLADAAFDALLLQPGSAPDLTALVAWPALSHAVLGAAVVVVAPDVPSALALRLSDLGVQDVLPAETSSVESIARALRLGVQRKRIEIGARKAYAIDLSTGLPNHAQLLEHMSHLLALREREPAPMALLVLRVEGLSHTERALGAEAVSVLRRKVAVRLRAGLRASDVVASIGTDAFAVMLAWTDASSDGLRVATKLAASLQRPITVAGQSRVVAVKVGVSQYPEHGKTADELLRRALGQASVTLADASGHDAGTVERRTGAAANDEAADP
ncbi:MAG: GGDEF domain-containing protein, partial [Rubrivivax sp.]